MKYAYLENARAFKFIGEKKYIVGFYGRGSVVFYLAPADMPQNRIYDINISSLKRVKYLVENYERTDTYMRVIADDKK